MAAEAAWVIAIIALMAFIVAAIALAVALNIYSAQQQTLELQRKQFEEQQRRARREQAAKVSFLVDVGNDRQFQLKVINASDYPILGVIAVLQPRTPNAAAVALTPNLLPTGATPYTMTWRPSVLPLSFGDLNTEHAVVFGVELWFEDSNGAYWRRNTYGKLAELTDVEQKQLDHLVADRQLYSGGV
jgi:type II secretory pathway pseudopilin PulG